MTNEDTNTTTTESTTVAADPSKPTKAKKAPTKAKISGMRLLRITSKAAKAKKAPAKKAAKGKKTAKKTDGGTTVKGPGVLRTYAPGYHKDTEKKTASGNPSIDNNDPIAQKLRGKDLDAVYGLVAKALKTKDETAEAVEKALRARYKNLNVGMQRMNLGNKLRAAANA